MLRLSSTDYLDVHSELSIDVSVYPSLDSDSVGNLDKYTPNKLPLGKQ